MAEQTAAVIRYLMLSEVGFKFKYEGYHIISFWRQATSFIDEDSYQTLMDVYQCQKFKRVYQD